MKREAYHSLRDLPRGEFLTPGGPLCSGCGGLLTLRLFHKALGENVIFVNAAGCLTLLAVYPYTPLLSSWLYLGMACAPAAAQGVRDALDILQDRAQSPAESDWKVVVLTGDGAAQDIGLQATMAAIHRGLDFYFIFATTTRSMPIPAFRCLPARLIALAPRLPLPLRASRSAQPNSAVIYSRSGVCKSRLTSLPYRRHIRSTWQKRYTVPRSCAAQSSLSRSHLVRRDGTWSPRMRLRSRVLQ